MSCLKCKRKKSAKPFHVKMALVSMIMLCSPAHALSISEAYELGINNDAKYLSAMRERDVGVANDDIGRAALMPTVGYTYNTAENSSEISRSLGINSFEEKQNYRSHSSTVSIEQPLFDLAVWSRYLRGQAQASEARHRFSGQTLELAKRVLTSYLAVMYARDQVQLAQRQQNILQDLLEQNRKRLQQGEGTITDSTETESLLYIAIVDLSEAEDEAQRSLNDLQQIVGRPLTLNQFPVLRNEYKSIPMDVPSITLLEDVAGRFNPEIAAHESLVEAARHDVLRARAAHLPRVSLYLSNRQSQSETENTLGQRFDTTSFGVRISVPIFNGGSTTAGANQAANIESQRRFELDKVRSTVINSIRDAHRKTLSGVNKLQSRVFSIKFSEARVHATRLSIAGGERVNQDLLDAQHQLITASRDKARAHYEYLKSWVDIHVLAGLFKSDHLKLLESQFEQNNSTSLASENGIAMR